MAYSESEKTLNDIRPLLVKLEIGQGDLFTAPPGMTARKLAYKIREAFHIANLFPEKYKALAEASKIFKIQVVNSRQVQAVLTDKQTGVRDVTTGGTIFHGVEPAGPLPLKVMGRQTAASIIEHVLAIQKAQPSNTQMSWPEAALSRSEKLRLYEWAHKQRPAWLLLVADDQVTLTRPSRNITEDLAWNPGDDD